ncbi:amidoligase family protein [Kangiella sp.]|uniref:amidoligase family protein n=1 Tax=Kangiella sp. TaxID=1920245 RepID=UPI003A8FBFB0
MPNADLKLKSPPWLKNADGKTRRIGVELEMSGLELDTIASLVANHFNLTTSSDGRYVRTLKGDNAGEWTVELDYDRLKKMGRKELGDKTFSDKVNRSSEELLAWAAKALVPVEVISPPLPLDRLKDVEGLVKCLRKKGAKGTADRAVNAFGLQLNPELASHEANHITACLKAFMCLYDWLYKRADIDLTRRITSYVDPFPTAYIKKIIKTDYRPELTDLIDDYLMDNPTRNRALDMLPLFKHLDEQRVLDKTDDELIKARPTFHYRLPNCDIDNPKWGIYKAWNDWVEVERLAADENRLQACCQAYEEYLRSPLKRLFTDWSKILEKQWLNP